ncbi:MAG: class I SAM-dependent methyltransferase [Proteobacteria bacterium]|nr:class I SAM-dependent methyltransferase [Pseudomonadota bacterium]
MTQDKQPDCFLCGHSMYKELRGLTDNRFGNPGEYYIAKCDHCGVLQTIPVPDTEQLKKLYEIYYNFGGEKGTIYTKVRDVFLNSFVYRSWMTIDGDVSFHSRRGQGQLLDIGCNEGRGLAIYQRNGFDPEGLELNEKAAQDARMAGFTVHIQPLEEFQPKKLFDIVVLSNVLEHAPNPKEMLKNIHRVLKPGGHVWISCPNSQSWLRKLFGRSWINWHVPFHLFHFSSKTLGQLLQRSGFEITELKYATPSHWMSQSIVAAISARRGRKTRHLRSPLLVAFLMLFCRFVLFPLLWVGNLTGRGDCLVVEAKKI